MNEIFDAIMEKDINKVSQILEKGVDVECRDPEKRTPLINAIIEKNQEIAMVLISKGSDVNAQDRNGWSALHFAVQNYDIKSICLLLDSGAKVDIKDFYGNTPLFRAIFSSKGKGEVIKLLLKFGADRDCKNDSEVSPYELAQQITNYNIKQFFE